MMRLVLGTLAVVVALLGLGFAALHRGDIPYATLDAKYRNADSRMLDLGDGLVVHWRDAGNPAGRPLLLVHGFSSSVQSWEKWTPLLEGDYRLISVDLPGHGLTRTPAGYDPSIERYADFLDTFMGAIKLDRATVIGSSMGGHAAWELALRHPERVEALVLVGAAGWRDPSATDRDEALIFKLLRNPVLGPLMRDLDNSALVRSGIRATFVNKALVDDAMVSRYVDLSRAPNHRQTLLNITLGFRTGSSATKERLSAIRVPTLVLHGAQDALVPVSGARLFGEAIPGARVVIYDKVGHLPQEEMPERSANDLQTFLRAAFPEPKAGAPLAAALP